MLYFLRKSFIFLVFGGIILPIFAGFAQTVVSPSSPLTDICIGDTRTLSPITVVETSVSGFSTTGTFILAPPANFEFIPGTGTVNAVGAGFSSSGSVTTSSQITINLVVSSTATFDLFEIIDLQVKAIAPSSFGNITRTGGTFVAGGQASESSTSYGFLSSILPPTITTQPTDKAVCSGSTVTLSVVADGSALSYQWQNDISGFYTNILGATTSTFVKANVSGLDAGNYRVIVTGSASCVPISVTSDAIAIAVDIPASIVTQPIVPSGICEGSSLSLDVFAAGTGLTYQWRKNGIPIAGALSPSYTKLNSTLSDSGNYTVVVTSNGVCVPSLLISNSVAVSVNPIPVLSSALAPASICSASTFSYTATSATAGSTFAWSRALVGGISQLANSGTGDVSETLTNTTTAPINVTYEYTTTANGCSSIQNVVVVVNPTPILSSTLTPAAICSGATFSYTPTSTTLGSSFSWSRLTTSGIIQPSNSGSGIINETLTNTTTGPINVTYQVVTLANGCANAVQNVIVSVNPTPQFTITNSAPAVCSNSTPTSITLNTPTSGGVITLLSTFAYPTGISGGTLTPSRTFNNGGVIAETLTNSTNSPITVTYTFSVSLNAGTCANTSTRFTSVVVNPTPKLAVLDPPAVCEGNTVDITQSGYIDATNSTSGLAYSYYESANTTLLATPSAINTSGTYFIRGTVPLTGCQVSSPIVVTINPLPIAQVAPVNVTVCSGDPILMYVSGGKSLAFRRRL